MTFSASCSTDDDTTVAGPDVPDRPRRLAQAEPLKRTSRLDVLACPECGQRMGLVAAVLMQRSCEFVASAREA